MLQQPVDPPPDEILAPQPGIADLPALAQHLTEAGLTVTMVRNGQPRALPTGVDLAAHRIVQEALTNVLKHSQAKTASVHIEYGPDVLKLKVDNEETSDTAATVSESNGGQGLLGMRERVTAYGGELQAGPDPDGGYSVAVRLPIPTA